MISRRQVCFFVLVAALASGVWGYVTAGRLLAEKVRLSLIPVLASTAGFDLAVDEVKVRPFPLFIELRGIQLVGADRGVRLEGSALRAYLDPLAYLLRREIRVTYLWGGDLRLSGSTEGFQKLAERLKAAKIGPPDEHPDAAQEPPKFKLQRFMLEKLIVDVDVAEKFHVASEPMRITGKTEPPSVEFWGGLLTIRGEGKGEWPVRVSGEISLASDETLMIRDLDLESNGAGVTLDGRLSLHRSELRIVADLPMVSVVNLLNLKGPSEGRFSVEGSIRADGTAPSAIALDLDVQGDGYVENLFEALDIPPEVKGHVSGKAHVSGRLTDPRASGHLSLENGSIIGLGEAWVESGFSFGDRTLRFDGGKGKIIGGEARRVEVGLTFGDTIVYNVSCEAVGVDSRRLFEFIGWVPPHRPGRMTGTVKVRGDTAALSFLNVKGHALFEGDGGGGDPFERIDRAESDFLYQDGVLQLDALSASAPEWKAVGAVRADFERESVIADFQAGGQEVGALLMERRMDLHAPFNMSGRVDGPWSSPIVAGKLVLGKGSVAGFAFDSAEAEANLHSDTLMLDRLIVRSGSALLDGSGTIRGVKSLQSDPSGRGVDLALNARVQGLEIAPVAALLGGAPEPFGPTRVSGRVRVTGSPVAARIEIRGRSAHGVVYGQAFDEAEFDVVAEPSAVTVRSLAVNRKRSALRVSGTVGRNVPSCLEFSDSRIYLEDIDGIPNGWQGLVRIDADCFLTRRAGQKAVDGSGRVSIDNLMFKKIPLGRADLNLSLTDRVLTAEGRFLEGLGKVSGQASLAESGSWAMDVSLARADYTKFVGAIFGTTKPEFAIEGGARARIRHLNEQTGGSIEVHDLTLSAYSQSFRSSDPVRIDVEGPRIVIHPVRLISGESYLEGQGRVDLGDSVDLRLNGKLDLLVLKAFSPAIESVGGTMWVVMEARGAWESPDINGGVYVDDGYATFKGVPGHFSQLKGAVFMENSSLATDDLTCRWGGGDLKLTGLGRIQGASISEFHYDLQASNILLQPIDDLAIRFDADLAFDGRGKSRYVSGDVVFAHAIYRGRVDYKSWLAQLRRKQAAPPESSWLGDTELNIHLTGSEPFRVENNLAHVSFWSDHRLLGTVSRPRLAGRVEVDQGRVFFRNHDFKVLSGSMDFVGQSGINPICDLKAETWSQGYAIRLTLDGPLDKLALNLESTPPLNETDILSLLTVGKISKDLKGLEGEIGAAEAASFLSGDIQDTVESKVTSLTGLERFQLDPYMSRTQGTIGPRLTVGKRLFSDKLFVTYSSDISTSEGQSVSVEYQLAPGATIVGEHDEMGNQGVDLRFHFKFD